MACIFLGLVVPGVLSGHMGGHKRPGRLLDENLYGQKEGLASLIMDAADEQQQHESMPLARPLSLFAALVNPVPPPEVRHVSNCYTFPVEENPNSTVVCVTSGNPLTASMFANRQLEFFGTGKYTYKWVHDPLHCPLSGPIALGSGPYYTNRLHTDKYQNFQTWGLRLQNLLIETGNELCGAELACRYHRLNCPARKDTTKEPYRDADFHQYWSDDRKGNWTDSFLPLGVGYSFKPVTDTERGFGTRRRRYLFNGWYKAGAAGAIRQNSLGRALQELGKKHPAMYNSGVVNLFSEERPGTKQHTAEYREVLLIDCTIHSPLIRSYFLFINRSCWTASSRCAP
jgi:hypothetical protein